MASDHEAVHPPRRVRGVECDAAGAIEQHGQHAARFDAGEGCADAEVDASPEGRMVARYLPVEIDLVRSFELGGLGVGGAPEQQNCGTGRDVDAAKRGVLGHGTHVVPERRLQAQRLFHERRDLLGVLAEMLLQLLVLG